MEDLKTARRRCPLKLDSPPNNVYLVKFFSTHVCIFTKDGQNMINRYENDELPLQFRLHRISK